MNRILTTRRHRTLRYEDLLRMGASMKKAKAYLSQPYETWHIEAMKRPYWD